MEEKLGLTSHAIEGNGLDNLFYLTHANAAATEWSEWKAGWIGKIQHLWSGEYRAGYGDDTIVRDRPGAYRYITGDAVIDGGVGFDTVSYVMATGAMAVHLDGAEHGTARALGEHDAELFGDDHLVAVEKVVGTDFSDWLTGSGEDEHLRGLAGDETLAGGGGADTLEGGDDDDDIAGGEGRDLLLGGDDRDTLAGGSDNDTLNGGTGNDTLNGEDGNDHLYGDAGWNVLSGAGGDDVLLVGTRGHADGGDGDDILVGGNLGDVLNGGDHDDTVQGLGGNDTATGGDGNDEIDGGAGHDLIDGDAGNDTLVGGDGNDTVTGGADSDRLYGGEGLDLAVWEGSGAVTLDSNHVGRMTAVQGGTTDHLRGFENVRTGGGDDVVETSGQANLVDLGDGDDIARAGGGNDSLLGGDGDDSLRGDLGNDVVSGGEGGDTLSGGSGADAVVGGDGDDRILGGEGIDTLAGGDGSDQFVFAPDIGADLVQDFELGEDVLVVGDLLRDGAYDNGSFDDEVFAVSLDNGASAAVIGLTDDGWQAIARLAGYGDDLAAVDAAIADGSLFFSPGDLAAPVTSASDEDRS